MLNAVHPPGDPKNAFLAQLDGASGNLRLFKADVLDYGTLAAAFAGCEGVFHPATPVPGDKLVDPEVRICCRFIQRTFSAAVFKEEDLLKLAEQ